MLINENKRYCYRIYHIQNLKRILQVGLCSKNHPLSTGDFVQIGNPQIITARSETKVRINDYGNIGDYIPFYFTPRSIMLYNIVTGYWAPLVPEISRKDIIIIRCEISRLSSVNRFFFTDGQANDALTKHYNDLSKTNKIDWENIQKGNFSKSDGDFDRPRRYQAEFLVYYHVPVDAIESIVVYTEGTAKFVENELLKAGESFPVHISPESFFN